MKYSYNWLKELSGTKKSPEQLADLLTMKAFEVESVKKVKGDTVLEIKILADRGHDALSHIGIVREICAIENRQSKHLRAQLPSKRSKILKVEIRDKKLCSRYIGVVMNNIKVAPSPKWMREKLEACGIRSINNIVDTANYVMLETGQPMHAFDLNKLTTDNQQLATINIRKAREGEEVKLLDGIVKKLSSEDLVIADSKKALAIAGIKGGAEAEISENTKSIVLEAANFNATAIRKSRMRLGLKTDSSDRFEKEIDPNLAETAMAYAVQIITKLGGKTEGIADVYSVKIKPWKIKLDFDYVSKLLGENIPDNMVKKILNSLELKTTGNGRNIAVTVPTRRIDLKTQEDLIEEIGRIYGYEKIKPLPLVAPVQAAPINEQRSFERIVRRILVGAGFSEVYNYSFYSQKTAGLAELGSIKHLELENPANPDQKLMRISLIPNILKNIAENIKYYKNFEIFEIGRAYWSNNEILPEEKRMLVGAMVLETRGKKHESRKKDTIFYEMKGCADILLKRLGINDYYYDIFNAVPSNTSVNLWHEGRSAQIKIQGREEGIGFIGEINPLILVNFDIHERVAIFEFNLEKLREVSQSEREYLPIRKYPEVTRDISLIAPQGILVDEILQAIQRAGGDLVLDVDLFDIFDFADGSSSYAFHIIFGTDKTLKSKEVDELMKKITDLLEKEFNIKVRK